MSVVSSGICRGSCAALGWGGQLVVVNSKLGIKQRQQMAKEIMEEARRHERCMRKANC